jgi:hypothetical protein
MKAKDTTTRAMHSPAGRTHQSQASVRKTPRELAKNSVVPQLLFRGSPRPRKLREASSRMAILADLTNY